MQFALLKELSILTAGNRYVILQNFLVAHLYSDKSLGE